jgi:hypothetical protein
MKEGTFLCQTCNRRNITRMQLAKIFNFVACN